ncbi:DUF6731 family protein [Desulfurobacterium sp.]
MRREKILTTYFLSFQKMNPNGEFYLLKGQELEEFFQKIRELTPKDEKEDGRYWRDREGVCRCLLFSDELNASNFQGVSKSDFIYGIFLRRREENYPYVEDGEGNLDEINLDGNKFIAEVTYFLVHMPSGVFIWTSNPRIGGISSIESYFNVKRDLLTKSGKAYFPYTYIRLDYIANPQKLNEFNKLKKISKALIKLDLTVLPEDMIDSLLSGSLLKGAVDVIRVAKSAKKIGSMSLYVSLSRGRGRKNFLKDEIKEILLELKEKKIAAGDSRLIATGKISKDDEKLDEEVRILDLLDDKLIVKSKLFLKEGQRYLKPEEVYERLFTVFEEHIDIINRLREER